MSIRPSVNNVSPRPTSPIANDGNSSAARSAATDEQPLVIRGDRHELLRTAPNCVKKCAAGKMSTTAGAFNTCVGWLVKNRQHEGLRDLLSSPKCRGFDTLDLHGELLDSEALGVLAHHLDRSCVTKLNLSGCQLESKEHAAAIGVLLGEGSKLALLNLSHNKIGDMAPICNALSMNRTLQHLNLRDCGLSALNYARLLNVLSKTYSGTRGSAEPENKTLQTLCLADNELVNPDMDIQSLEREFKALSPPYFTTGLRWLDLSNTGITLSSDLMLSLRAGVPRLDLARNHIPSGHDRFVSQIQNVAHLNMQGVTGTDLSTLPVIPFWIQIPGLRVLDLRGVDMDRDKTGFVIDCKPPYGSFVCVRLDSEVAKRLLRELPKNVTALSSGDLVFPGAGFLASWSPPGLSGGIAHLAYDLSEVFAGKLDEELDVRSIASLVSVNTTLRDSRGDNLERALRMHTADPSFDWDQATMIAKDPPDAEDVSDRPPVSVLMTTTSLSATTATTTTTTDLTMTTATTGTGASGS